ncbi:MAG: L-alanine exporter AlaE [bacterium]
MKGIKKAVADTFAMIVFSTFFGIIVEVFVSGMTLSQSGRVRFIALWVNLLIGRPYGWFRDKILKLLKAEKNKKRKVLADLLAFALFQIPIYIGILVKNGAGLRQVIIASFSITFLSVFILGGPYGAFLDLCRKIFKVK